MTAILEQTLRRFRTRARAVMFVRAVLMATPAAIALTLLWGLAWESPRAAGPVAYALSVSLAIVAAAAVATRHAITLRATAALIDSRLHLQNHISAAVQVAHEAEPMATLVVRTAVERLRNVTPVQVFPLAAGRPALATGAVVLVTLLVTMSDKSSVWSQPSGVATSASSGASSVGNGRPDAPDAAAKTLDSRQPEVRFAKVTPEAGLAEAGGATVHSSPQPSPSPTDASGTIDPPSSPSSSTDFAPKAAAAGVQNAVSHASAGNASGTGALARGGDSSRHGEGTPANAEQTASGAGGNGQGPRSATQPGGVSAGSLEGTGEEFDSSQPSRAPVPGSLSPAAARAQAAAALTRDDIPPPFRSYVRDYFLRLQSTGGRQ